MTSDRPFVLDVSRLIWRRWAGRLPTGIDRVCLAYLDHFGSRSLALVKRGEMRIVLGPRQSDRLFELLRRGNDGFKRRLVKLMAQAAASRSGTNVTGKVYLNIGHTGLDAPGLPAWLEYKKMRPLFLVHDLIPITHPEFCRIGEDAKHARRMHTVLTCAHGIIANSQATLDSLAHFAAARGQTMPEGLVAWLGADTTAEPASDDPLPGASFVMIGTIEARKNHLLILHIWERLITSMQEDAPHLVLVGQRGWEADEVFALLDRSPLLRSRVHELGRCSDEEMLAKLQGARALLMPSFIEGFGIPVIEALQLGTPVIASDLPVFREIAGTIPLYLDPLDGHRWEEAIRDFLQDSDERQRQLAQMPGFTAPTWAGHFAAVDRWIAQFDPA